LGGWDGGPERGGARDEGLPGGEGGERRGGEAVVEEGVDVGVGGGDEADEAAWWILAGCVEKGG